jgi:hypothetical protein
VEVKEWTGTTTACFDPPAEARDSATTLSIVNVFFVFTFAFHVQQKARAGHYNGQLPTKDYTSFVRILLEYLLVFTINFVTTTDASPSASHALVSRIKSHSLPYEAYIGYEMISTLFLPSLRLQLLSICDSTISLEVEFSL